MGGDRPRRVSTFLAGTYRQRKPNVDHLISQSANVGAIVNAAYVALGTYWVHMSPDLMPAITPSLIRLLHWFYELVSKLPAKDAELSLDRITRRVLGIFAEITTHVNDI